MLTKFRLIGIFTLLITASLSGEATQRIKFREPTNALQSQTVVYDDDGNEVTVVYDDPQRHKAEIISQSCLGISSSSYKIDEKNACGIVIFPVVVISAVSLSILASCSALPFLYLNFVNPDSSSGLRTIADIYTPILLISAALCCSYCALFLVGTYLWYKLPFPQKRALHAFAPASMSENAVKTLVAEEGFIL